MRKRNEEARLAEDAALADALPNARAKISNIPKRSTTSCAICHRRAPPGSDSASIQWYACDNKESCGVWLHSTCNTVNTACKVCGEGIVREEFQNVMEHDYY